MEPITTGKQSRNRVVFDRIARGLQSGACNFRALTMARGKNIALQRTIAPWPSSNLPEAIFMLFELGTNLLGAVCDPRLKNQYGYTFYPQSIVKKKSNH